MSFKYAYLIGDLILLPIWLIVFFLRIDLRKEMVYISLVGSVIGLLLEPLYIRDYWIPQTLNGLPISIEDILFGFFTSGIASTIYKFIFGVRFTKKKNMSIKYLDYLILGFILLIIFYVVVLMLGVNSVIATIIICISVAIGITVVRRDLIWDTLLSGLLMGIIITSLYSIYLKIYPGIIQKWWMLGNFSGYFILGLPIEEIVWYMGVGFLIGPIYDFMTGLKLAKKQGN